MYTFLYNFTKTARHANTERSHKTIPYKVYGYNPSVVLQQPVFNISLQSREIGLFLCQDL